MRDLTQQQVGLLLGVTRGRVAQMHREPDPPPRGDGARYPACEFGEWLRRRYDGGDKSRLLKAQADRAEHERDVQRGKYVLRDGVAVAYGEKVRALADQLRAIPDRIAIGVAAETDGRKCWRLISDAIEGAMAVVAGPPPTVAK